MATGESFGYGLISGLTGYSSQMATGALSQALGMLNQNNAAAQTAYFSYDPYHNGFTVSSSSSAMITGISAAAPSKAKCCGRGEAEPHAPDCWKLTDVCECHSGRASKNHSFLWRLRKEIEGWHGDVLERCPA